ncbi:ComF family protein [Paenibacillus sp. JCM 10914]|uniref:ComF family protein n=1 Tax=Paenibacillus sp. JCM 10914 TaxID=1236974 RepID=UPI00056328FF|nr:ComF family protein [Paenibacillus sp. JCM 10914]
MFNRLLGYAHRLMAPEKENCLTCGKTGSFTRELPNVCHACRSRIPWIANVRCLRCGRGIGCPDCSRVDLDERSFVLNRSAVTYTEQMREWLAQYKYRGNEGYANVLIAMLVRAYAQLHREANHGTRDQHRQWNIHAVTSVPVSDERLRERGFNQAEVLAQGLAARMQLPYVRLLVRNRHTDKQSFKSRMDRLRDMQNVFGVMPEAPGTLDQIVRMRVKESVDERGQTPLCLLLIDDIYTTGSTINACAAVLKRYEVQLGWPIEIYSLTWARS